jgi:hypothetical protein
MNGLTESIRQQGMYTEAEEINRQKLQLQETVLRKDHPSTLRSMKGLTESLRQQSKYTEAKAIYWQ